MPRLMYQSEIPASVPDIGVDWWPDAPWMEPADDMVVDRDRTAGLKGLHPVVRSGANTPIQVANFRNTSVTTWRKWVPTGVHRVPLAEKVWLLRNGDDQWFGVNPEQGQYWECSAVGPSLIGGWRADSVFRFDRGAAWNSKNGLAGGGIPIWALVARVGALRAGSGGVMQALNLSVAGNYARACVPWLTKTDGSLLPSQHPLRAGERLRLTEEAYQRLTGIAETADDFAFLWTLRHYGVIVNDKTSATAGHAIRMSVGCVITIRLALADFEVLVT